MLRSSFLAYSPDRFITLVQGSLQLLDTASLPPPPPLLPQPVETSQSQSQRETQSQSQCQEGLLDDLGTESWIISSAIDASPDSMNLLPDRIAVMDLGNFILIRAGLDVDDAGGLINGLIGWCVLVNWCVG